MQLRPGLSNLRTMQVSDLRTMKVTETSRVLHTAYLEEHKLSDRQMHFRKMQSCGTQLIMVIHDGAKSWKRMNKRTLLSWTSRRLLTCPLVTHKSTVARTVMCRQDSRRRFPVLLDDLSKCRTNSQRKSQLS